MSKIGRRPIQLTTAKVEISGQQVTIKGAKASFVHHLPEGVLVALEGKELMVSVKDTEGKSAAMWGLHRALLANKVKGVESGFEQKIKIVGLGLKAQAAGKKLTFSLGYSHKIEYEVPAAVDIDIDKTGQLLALRSADKELLGQVCDSIRSFRKPEPYKGTGIMLEGEVIIRKAGKTKA